MITAPESPTVVSPVGTSRTAALRRVVGLSVRRQWTGVGVAVVTLPLVTAILTSSRDRLSQAMIFLLYLSLVVVLAAIGGPVVGVITAAAAFLLVNWFFTEPLHTLNVAGGERVTELVIFLAVSGAVASLVSTATRRTIERDHEAETAEQLRATNELRSALLRAVSHDLRTPLATVKMATSSLRATDIDWDERTRRELIETADGEIDRLVRIVENLLDASRLQTGIVTASLMDVALADAIAGALSTLEEADRHRVDVVLPVQLSEVVADRALLERVIANLVSNALAADIDGRLTVVAEPTAGMVEMRIVDHGPGIAPDRRAAVFQPFQRFSDRSTSAGLGLGLAICQGFCDAMDVELRLDETSGGGTTAVVVLPVVM
jgi:two-component system, OmpR family, sensor histidine kinase KdpD